MSSSTITVCQSLLESLIWRRNAWADSGHCSNPEYETFHNILPLYYYAHTFLVHLICLDVVVIDKPATVLITGKLFITFLPNFTSKVKKLQIFSANKNNSSAKLKSLDLPLEVSIRTSPRLKSGYSHQLYQSYM